VCSHNPSHTRTGVDISKLGHDWAWVITTAPTFITEGEETETCKHDSSHTKGTRVADPLPITTTDEWNAALAELNGKTGEYTLNISGNVGIAGSTADSFGTTASGSSLIVTLKGNGKLYLTSQGNIIRIGTRQTLIIDSEYLTLDGLLDNKNGATQSNNESAVYVMGTLKLLKGAITENAKIGSSSMDGAGVYVGSSATFEMSGGRITGNLALSDSLGFGGGVYVSKYATFKMIGGEISGNTGSRDGGGVYVDYGDTFYMTTFEMSGGKIINNTCATDGTSSGGGGGVHVRGTFIMTGGEISGNTGNWGGGGVEVYDNAIFTMSGGKISGNTATRLVGGGVRTNRGVMSVGANPTFTMSGGEISGNTATDSDGGGVFLSIGSFTMTNGEISGNIGSYGGGLSVGSGTFRISNGTIYGSNEAVVNLRNTGIGAALNIIDSNYGTAQHGTFSGENWTSSGDLNTTNNTIKVIGGNLL
jgi:hypothetical protein